MLCDTCKNKGCCGLYSDVEDLKAELISCKKYIYSPVEEVKVKTPEYIERNALIAEYDRVHQGPAGSARKLMVEAPAVDAVEVVRCKDCIYSYRENDYRFGYTCVKPLFHPNLGERTERKLMQDIDFCSYGVRRR